MQKKILSNFPIQTLTHEQLELLERSKAIWYFSSVELLELQKDTILCLNIYRNGIKEIVNKPIYRVFFNQNENDYMTQALNGVTKSQWLTSKLENIFIRYENMDYRFIDRMGYIDNDSFLKLKQHFGNHVFNDIFRYQDKIGFEKLKLKHKIIKDSIDEEMRRFLELPKNFENWCDRSALCDSRYIFYRRRKGDKATDGYCTYCHSEVKVAGPRHNHKGRCPNCKKKVIFKAIGISKHIIDKKDVCILQKIANGFSARYFHVTKKYTMDFRNPKLELFEFYRILFNDDKSIKEFVWGDFKLTGEYRWCNNIRYFDPLDAVFYPVRFSNLLKNTPWQYCAYQEYSKRQSINPIQYFKKYITAPFLEYFIKCKMDNLVRDVMNCSTGRSKETFNYSGKNMSEVLNIDKRHIKQISKLDLTEDQFLFYRSAWNYNTNLSVQVIQRLETKYRMDSKLFHLMKYASIEKIENYLVRRCREEKLDLMKAFTNWRDYVGFCEIAGLNLSNEITLFPKNLVIAHRNMLKKTRYKRTPEQIEKHKLLEEKANKLFSKLKNIYSWCTDKHSILVPNCIDEIAKEGEILWHCVGIGNYIEHMVDGKIVILFLRMNDAIDVPFYTIELRNNEILQCHGFDNKNATKEINDVLSLYLNEMKLKLAS